MLSSVLSYQIWCVEFPVISDFWWTPCAVTQFGINPALVTQLGISHALWHTGRISHVQWPTAWNQSCAVALSLESLLHCGKQLGISPGLWPTVCNQSCTVPYSSELVLHCGTAQHQSSAMAHNLESSFAVAHSMESILCCGSQIWISPRLSQSLE